MTQLPADYDLKTAGEKLDLLWDAVKRDPYPRGELPTKTPGLLEARKLLSVAHNRGSFEHISDEMEPGRVKLIHRYGTCARVTVRVTGEHPFTGVFASGGPALLRLSDGPGIGPTLLGAALKFFLDGRPSMNFFASPHTTDRPRRGALSTVMANSLPPAPNAAAKLIAGRFQKTADALEGKRLYSNYLPLHQLASTRLDGEAVEAPVVPDRVVLRATDEALDLALRKGDWRARLEPVPAGTTLFELHIAAEMDKPATPFAELVLDSTFVASRFGDEQLFFQHDVGPKR